MFRFIHVWRAKWQKIRAGNALEFAEESSTSMTDEYGYWVERYKERMARYHAIVEKYSLTEKELE